MKAILVAVKLKDNKNFEETLHECLNLCHACDIHIVKTITQASNYLDPNTAIRKGKLEELKEELIANDIHQVVFYNNLSTNVVSNIKDYLGEEVMDRTSLILHIFSLRAKSKEAQIQTEIARLKYDMPQLLKNNMDEDRMRGGTFNNRGAGENRSAIIRRMMESRINELKVELKKLEARKDIEYQKRNKSDLKKVALVGYTNAGKSSLMNNLLEKNGKEDKTVLEKNQLFATLDTSVRKITYKKFEFLLFDTVGFVSDLPHELIEAFKSTLKAASYADLLIHVIDASNPNYLLQQETTLDTLRQIRADSIKMINVYNKCDLLEEKKLDDCLYVSCKDNTGIDKLLDIIVENLNPQEEKRELLIPYSKFAILEKYKSKANFMLISHEENGAKYAISSSKEILDEICDRIQIS